MTHRRTTSIVHMTSRNGCSAAIMSSLSSWGTCVDANDNVAFGRVGHPFRTIPCGPDHAGWARITTIVAIPSAAPRTAKSSAARVSNGAY